MKLSRKIEPLVKQKKRTCYVCRRELNFEEFYKAGWKNENLHGRIQGKNHRAVKWWLDDRVELLCCSCIKTFNPENIRIEKVAES